MAKSLHWCFFHLPVILLCALILRLHILKQSTSSSFSLSTFQHNVLDDPESCIRLLELLPAQENDPQAPLFGLLKAYRRQELPAYHPVSYAWRSQEASSEMLLKAPDDEQWSRFAIRPNLEALLLQMRLHNDGPLWVDAICIDQSNNTEKAYQVQNMEKLYQGQDLRIWLGQDSHDSDLALGYIEHMGVISAYRKSKERGEQVGDFPCKGGCVSPKVFEALYNLFSRPWFSRRWIVQEFVLSQDQEFWIGDRHYPFSLLHQAWASVGDKLKMVPRKHRICMESPYHSHLLPSKELDPIEAFGRLYSAYETSRKNPGRLTLERLLDSFESFKSCDFRDGIYSFLSMASDIDREEWLPNYSPHVSTTNLYGKAVFHIIRKSGSLDIICRCNQEDHLASARRHLSSWIPWFGPQPYNFPSLLPRHDHQQYTNQSDGVEVCRSCEQHVGEHEHDIHGYKVDSLTTFGLPLRDTTTSRRHAQCDGCGQIIHGSVFQCTTCENFDYCYECIKNSTRTHNSSHLFSLAGRAAYAASSCRKFFITDEVWRKCDEAWEWPMKPLPIEGYLVDTIQELGEEPRPFIHNGEACGTIYPWSWINLPVMENYMVSPGVPSLDYYRAMVGGRRIIRDQLYYATDEWLENLERWVLPQINNSRAQARAQHPDFVPLEEFDEADEASELVTQFRRFATTTRRKSFGFVPLKAQKGDWIAILPGCSVPVVIRPWEDTSSNFWTLIGECYIHGIMDGEFIDESSREGRKSQKMTLV